MYNPVLLANIFFSSVKSILRGITFRPEHIDIPIGKFLSSLGKNIEYFVKIGSNDGVKNDPFGDAIKKYNWKGIMVEPFGENFKRLEANFGGQDNIILEQAGIAEKSGSLDFFYIDNIRDDEPGWYDQVGSFDRATFIKNIEVEPSLLSRIASTQIPCLTFAELVEKHSLRKVDLIHIDAEGYDYKILETIDLKKIRPRVVIFELEWLTLSDIRKAKALLFQNRYKLYFSQGDCIAIRSR